MQRWGGATRLGKDRRHWLIGALVAVIAVAVSAGVANGLAAGSGEARPAEGMHALTRMGTSDVQRSERELDEIQAEVSRELEDLMRAGLLITGIRARAVVVTVAARADADVLARIERTVAKHDGAVELERSSAPSLVIRTEPCTPAASCGG
jgi:hypothetical protein